MIDRASLTPEVLANTLGREIWPEVRAVVYPKMGKVRTVYDVGDNRLVMISSDNLSTHNIVHKRQVYGKGESLNAISSYYFGLTQDIIPNHFLETLGPNAWLTQRADPILVEMVFRATLTGSAWKDYVAADGPKKGADFCGVHLRPGYRENERLDEVICTPTAKGHVKDFSIPEFEGLDPEEDDPKITINVIRRNYGAFGLRKPGHIDYVAESAFNLFSRINKDLEETDDFLADTKWEFGYLSDGRIGLIDECVTPDSSRIWSVPDFRFDGRKFAVVQRDKQVFRDYIESLGLDKNKAALAQHWMPDNVIIDGIMKYADIRKKITGTEMEVTTQPRKEAVLEALAERGLLR